MFFYVFLFIGCTSHPTPSDKDVKRVALVIGNQNYQDNALKNPRNDAQAIANTLQSMDFKVNLLLDSTLSQLNMALSQVKRQIEPDKTLLLIYFAGHGNTLKEGSDEQYLMMVDSDKKVLVSIYKLYDFINQAKARHNLVIIDACRDYKGHYVPEKNVVASNYRGNFEGLDLRSTDGIKKKENVKLDNDYSHKILRSTLVSYATDPYQRAKDWSIHDKGHSPYSYALIQHLDDEEVPIGEVFRRVRESVLAETNRTQASSENTKLEKNIWLVPKRAEVAFAPPI